MLTSEQIAYKVAEVCRISLKNQKLTHEQVAECVYQETLRLVDWQYDLQDEKDDT